MPKKNKKPEGTPETILVAILHNHDGEFSTTVGRLKTTDDVERDGARIRRWLDRKFEEHECHKFGDKCGADIRDPNSRSGVVLNCGAEDIE